MTTDEGTDPRSEQTESERAVLREVEAEQREAFGFKTAAYAQRLYADLEHQVRTDRALLGRTTEELDGEVRYRRDRESRAIHQLSRAEVEICHVMGVKPSDYLLYRPTKS
ncbi:MAG: hypothetical protein IH956_01395 [Chloroflexi bacterium]|nr:hypothetical protein [Chloroflexota bacterium]